MKTPAAAPAPDANALAQAQSQSNKQTAITQAQMNMIDQITPQGTLKYQQQGTWENGDPRFAATQAYSPDQQKLYDLSNQTEANIGQIGVEQSGRIKELLGTPYQSTAATDNKIAQMQRGFLDPQWGDQQKALESQLISKGLRPGTAAYDREMGNFSKNRQSAYDQMYLDAYKTAEGSALTERNQPINEISALLSQSQVSNPSYAQTPTTGVAPTDVIGANQLSLNQQNLNNQNKVKSHNAMMQGLFGLGSAAMGGWGMSDRRVKEDIKKVGKLDSGLNVYSYKYKGGGLMQLGLMAQEVEKELPDAVAEIGGIKHVNYAEVSEAAR
jgi:hypothetical protein